MGSVRLLVVGHLAWAAVDRGQLLAVVVRSTDPELVTPLRRLLPTTMVDAPFDFRVVKHFSQEDFNRTIVNGPAGIKAAVAASTGEGDGTFLGVQCSLAKDRTLLSARWVGGGALDGTGAINFKASSLFPLAPAGLFLSVKLTLDLFEWPGNSSNFSHYIDCPGGAAVAAYEKGTGGESRFVDWELAKGQGCAPFAVRAIVLPHATSSCFVQIGAVPFTVAHMHEQYGAVFEEPYFPNFMLSVTKTPTVLPAGSRHATSRLVQRVALQLPDAEGFGLGTIPFFDCVRFAAAPAMPDFALIQATVFNHMQAGRHPVAKSAAAFPAALKVALEADKNPLNLVDRCASPWPVLNTIAQMKETFEGWCFSSIA